MAYGLHPYAGQSFGGAKEAAPSSGTVITDPANPSLPGYRWQNQVGPGAYGQVAFAGGGTPDLPVAAGLQAIADSGTGKVNLTAWWSNATYLRLTRIVKGQRQPVRGAYPIVVTTPTRRQHVTNPSLETDTAGWLAGANTTIARVVGPVLAGVAHLRVTATAAGTATVTVPVSLPLSRFGLSLALRTSATPSGSLTATASWIDSLGGTLTPTTATISSANLAPFLNTWGRSAVLTIDPPGTASLGSATLANGTLKIAVAGMAAGATFDLDMVLVEAGDSTGLYFDGDSRYGLWEGTKHASRSSLAAPQAFVDSEAPLDVPFSYELTAPHQPGNRLTSEPLTIASLGQVWLTHPRGDTPLSVWVTAAPELNSTIKRGVYEVVDRPRPIAVSANIRQAPTGSMTLYCEEFGVRDRITDLFEDGAPVLFRFPADLGYGLGWWCSIGDVTERSSGHGAWGPRYLDLPFTVVDEPAVA